MIKLNDLDSFKIDLGIYFLANPLLNLFKYVSYVFEQVFKNKRSTVRIWTL